jgi:hypothetical protein
MCAMSGNHSWLWKMAPQELAGVYERSQRETSQAQKETR